MRRSRLSPEVALLLGLGIAAFGLFVLGRLLRDWRGADRTRRFVATHGRLRGVHRGTTRTATTRGSVAAPHVAFQLRVRYSYEVAGQEHVGTRYGYGRIGRKEWLAARALLDARQEGSAIEVWYDPNRPADAVVVRGLLGRPWRELSLGGGAVAIGVALVHDALERLASVS